MIKCHFFNSVFFQLRGHRPRRSSYWNIFKNELKCRPKRDFNTAHVQLGWSLTKVQLPRACLGKAALIMGGWGYEVNRLCKLLTRWDEMRKKPIDDESEYQNPKTDGFSCCFEPWIFTDLVCLLSCSKFLHNRSGNWSPSYNPFHLSEWNVSNGIYIWSQCV